MSSEYCLPTQLGSDSFSLLDLFFLGLFIQQASQNGNSFELILDPQIPELGIASDSAPESRANKHKSPENTYKPKASGS